MSKRLTKTIWYGSDVDSNGNPILPSTHGGLDGLNYGELFLHLSNGKASLWTLSSDGKIVEITGGGSEVDMSSYLLKSVWDKVFEIRTDSQGTEYIFGKLPVVTQYGITMYSGDGVNVPSLASGLPFDGRTIWYNPDTNQIEVIGGTGGGSGEGVSNFWDLSGIPSWITNSKPKYTYSEIEGTPDLTKYALASQIPSLSGYATESWVLQKNYATKATTLSGYGITDAYTKTNVDELLKTYVTLGGTQTITGEKNFVGGLKVNGSPIYYDTEKKYWKLEGDLLVTGGVTMYGSDSSFTPSTIMDAILYDSATLGINSNGQLYVKGGTSGGGLDITALQNYLTQNSYLNVTSGDNRYLKLSGGTISNNGYALILNRESENPVWIQFRMQNEFVGAIGGENGALRFMDKNSKVNTVWHSGNFNPSNYLPLSGGTINGDLFVANSYGGIVFTNTSNNSNAFLFYNGNADWYVTNKDWGAGYKIWHEGNDGSGSGLDADLLDGLHNGELTALVLSKYSDTWNYSLGNPGFSVFSDWNNTQSLAVYFYGISIESVDNGYRTVIATPLWGNGLYWRRYSEGDWPEDWRCLIDSYNIGSYNAGSATKLQTARTIWGQSFDGTGNVDGDFTQTKGGSYGGAYGDNSFYIYNRVASDIQGRAGVLRWAFNDYSVFKRLDILGEDIGTTTTIASFLDNGNVGLGTPHPACKLDINSSDAMSLKLNSSKTDWGYAYNSIGIYHSDIQKGGFGWNSESASLSNVGFYFKNYVSGDCISLTNEGGIYLIGNVLVSGGLTFYSMRKLKNVVDERGLSLSELSTIKPTRYTWKDGRDNRLHFGGIADDIQQVLPEVVYSTSDGILTMDYGNAAFAIASSLIQPVVNHEKRIAMLEEENKQLRQEVERLKSA